MRFLFIPLFVLLAIACNKSGEAIFEDLESELGDPSVSSLEITPSIVSKYVSSTQQFVASGGVTPYSFSILSGGGSVSDSGLYTAPSSATVTTLRVSDSAGAVRDALIIVEVEISLTPANRKANVSSTFQFSTNGGVPPYSYSVTSGTSTINSSGIFVASSTPEIATVRVTDSNSVFAEATVDVGNGPIISPVSASSPISTNFQYTATSGTAPYTWAVVSGLGSIDSSGLFSAAATNGVSIIKVTDANGYFSESTMTVFNRNQVTANGNNTCILNGDTNVVKCWGQSNFGATGTGNMLIGDLPIDMGENLKQVKLPTTVSAKPTIMATTLMNSCAIFDDNLTRCWGSSFYGQNGNNGTSSGVFYDSADAYILPVPTYVGNPIKDLARKSNAWYHQCAIYQDDTLKCWGYGLHGQLGQGGTENLGDNYTSNSLLTANPINLGVGNKAVKVETGSAFSCAILDNKNVKCWGRNDGGQLGLGHVNSIGDGAGEMAALAELDFPLDVIDIALGDATTCVILTGGGIRCWGSNGSGQLGLGTVAAYGDTAGEVPTALADLDMGHVDPGNPVTPLQAVKIDLGNSHACALFQNAQVKCWGNNAQGQLGQEDTFNRGDNPNELGNNLPFVNLGVGRSAVDIAVGGNTSCAILDNGDTKCWGLNSSGQLGIGLDHRLNQGDGISEMADNLIPLNLGAGTSVLQISPQSYTNCILLTEDGSNVIKCLGSNTDGVLGIEDIAIGDDPSEKGSNVAAVDLGTTKTIAEISGGPNFNCARFVDGSAKCWGYNSSLVLGTNTLNGVAVGTGAFHMGLNLAYVSPGVGLTIQKMTGSKGTQYTACALLSNNNLKCWGYNGQGQLGQDSITALGSIPTIPAINLGLSKYAVDVSVGSHHVCAIINDGSVKCWGKNWNDAVNMGVLGLGISSAAAESKNYGDQAGEMALLPTVNFGDGLTALQICSGDNHNCLITNERKVKCWGLNTSAQLGLGHLLNIGDSPAEMGNSLPYVDLGANQTVSKLACGSNHTCALLDNKKIKCWGYNWYGQLGYNSSTSVGSSSNQMGENLPYVNVGTGLTVLDVKAGGAHTCALLSNNSVKCWGNNNYGQLGQGSTVNLGDNIGEMASLLPIVID